MSKIDNLCDTIVPKSDQLNADDLIVSEITVTIKAVKRMQSKEQPIALEIGEGRQPYKPGLSMRRVLISVWGKNGNDWVGKSLTLFNEKSVLYKNSQSGGIRISHMSGIEKPVNIMLTVARGRKANYKVEPLATPQKQDQCSLWCGWIDSKADKEGYDVLISWFDSSKAKEIFSNLSSDDQEKVGNYYRKKCSSLSKK